MKLEDIKREILAGRKLNAAISIDTSIFDGHGLRLKSGWLKLLEQFSKNPGTLLITDVVRSEVHKHLTKKMLEARDSLSGARQAMEEHWDVAVDVPDGFEAASTENVPNQAASRLDDFLSRCKALVLKAEGLVSVERLMSDYFAAKAPFENSGAKKSEFPDAVALNTLDAWSRQTGRYVLLVSGDRGWKSFADASDRLCCVESLETAINVFQQRDASRAEMLQKLVSFFREERWSAMDELAGQVSELNWGVEAPSWHSYEVNFDLSVSQIKFTEDDLAESLHAVDLADDKLTVAANLEVTLDVEADFSFELEGVSLGGASVSEKATKEVTALLTFDMRNPAEPELVEADWPRRHMMLQLQQVDPDYSAEDPEDERY